MEGNPKKRVYSELDLTTAIEDCKRCAKEFGQSIENCLNKKNELYKELEDRLNKKDERYNVLKARLNEKGKRCNELENRLNEKDERCNVLKASLKEKYVRCIELENRVFEVERQLQEKKTTTTEVIESEFQCSICSELFINVVTLQCAHSYCDFCIKKWMAESEKRRCPLCRKRIKSIVPSLVLDNFITRYFAADSMPATLKKQRRKLIAKRLVRSLVPYA